MNIKIDRPEKIFLEQGDIIKVTHDHIEKGECGSIATCAISLAIRDLVWEKMDRQVIPTVSTSPCGIIISDNEGVQRLDPDPLLNQWINRFDEDHRKISSLPINIVIDSKYAKGFKPGT